MSTPTDPSANQSLFNHLQTAFEQPLPITHLQKLGLIEISQALKKTTVRRQLPAVVLTSLQPLSEAQHVRRWYQRILQRARLVALFLPKTAPQLTYDDAHCSEPAYTNHEIEIALPADHSLVHEFFIILLTPECSVLVCARPNLLEVGASKEKQVADVIVSYDPPVIQAALDFLTKIVARTKPACLPQLKAAFAAIPPGMPKPDFLMWFSIHTIKQLGFYRQQVRKVDQDNAMRATIARLLHDASQPVTTLVNLLEMAQGYNQIDPYEIELLLNASNELKQILDHLREVSRFRTSKVEDTYYLDTGNPFYKGSQP